MQTLHRRILLNIVAVVVGKSRACFSVSGKAAGRMIVVSLPVTNVRRTDGRQRHSRIADLSDMAQTSPETDRYG